MDGFEIGAFKAVLGIAVFAIGLLAGSLLGAIFLRTAAVLLNLGDIPFVTAFRSVLVSSFTVCTLHFSIGLNHGLTAGYLGSFFSEGRTGPLELRYFYSPHFFLLSATFSLLVTAAVFTTTLRRNGNDSRLKFVDSLTLAAFYLAICIVFVLLVALLVLVLSAMVSTVK